MSQALDRPVLWHAGLQPTAAQGKGCIYTNLSTLPRRAWRPRAKGTDLERGLKEARRGTILLQVPSSGPQKCEAWANPGGWTECLAAVVKGWAQIPPNMPRVFSRGRQPPEEEVGGWSVRRSCLRHRKPEWGWQQRILPWPWTRGAGLPRTAGALESIQGSDPTCAKGSPCRTMKTLEAGSELNLRRAVMKSRPARLGLCWLSPSSDNLSEKAVHVYLKEFWWMNEWVNECQCLVSIHLLGHLTGRKYVINWGPKSST